jgi:hypothetical protein
MMGKLTSVRCVSLMSFHPFKVRIERVYADGQYFYVSLVELVLQLGRHAQFGGAYGRKIGGVREEHAPVVAQPLVEINGSFGGICRKVGGYIA